MASAISTDEEALSVGFSLAAEVLTCLGSRPLDAIGWM